MFARKPHHPRQTFYLLWLQLPMWAPPCRIKQKNVGAAMQHKLSSALVHQGCGFTPKTLQQ